MITSENNAALKHLTRLIKKSRTRYESNSYVVEGIRMYREIPPYLLKNVYVSESFYNKNEEEFSGVNCEILSDKIFLKISDNNSLENIIL